MSRPGFSVQELSDTLGIHPGSVTTAINPALVKLAKLYLRDQVKFWEMWLPFIREQQEEIEQRRFESELPTRCARQTGKANRTGHATPMLFEAT